MVNTKPSRTPEGIESKNSTDKNKGQAPKSKKYIGKNIRTKSQGPDHESKTDFKVHYSELYGYIFDLSPRALEKFFRIMKEL